MTLISEVFLLPVLKVGSAICPIAVLVKSASDIVTYPVEGFG